ALAVPAPETGCRCAELQLGPGEAGVVLEAALVDVREEERVLAREEQPCRLCPARGVQLGEAALLRGREEQGDVVEPPPVLLRQEGQRLAERGLRLGRPAALVEPEAQEQVRARVLG